MKGCCYTYYFHLVCVLFKSCLTSYIVKNPDGTGSSVMEIHKLLKLKRSFSFLPEMCIFTVPTEMLSPLGSLNYTQGYRASALAN